MNNKIIFLGMSLLMLLVILAAFYLDYDTAKNEISDPDLQCRAFVRIMEELNVIQRYFSEHGGLSYSYNGQIINCIYDKTKKNYCNVSI